MRRLRRVLGSTPATRQICTLCNVDSGLTPFGRGYRLLIECVKFLYLSEKYPGNIVRRTVRPVQGQNRCPVAVIRRMSWQTWDRYTYSQQSVLCFTPLIAIMNVFPSEYGHGTWLVGCGIESSMTIDRRRFGVLAFSKRETPPNAWASATWHTLDGVPTPGGHVARRYYFSSLPTPPGVPTHTGFTL